MNYAATPDFTEARYRALVEHACSRFRFRRFGDDLASEGIALWRHDIDFSPQRARALARIESDLGVTATYFVLLGSPFYNPFEEAVRTALCEIAGMGHDIGLHYDAASSAVVTDGHEERIAFEAATLSRQLRVPIRAFSLHNPSVSGGDLDAPRHAGLINASASELRAQFTYTSDSNGLWRFRALAEMIADPSVGRLYALTHPEWWQSEPMPPRQRLQRCIDGRKTWSENYYDALLTAHSRPNIGRKEM
jgi:hypothetical protein